MMRISKGASVILVFLGLLMMAYSPGGGCMGGQGMNSSGDHDCCGSSWSGGQNRGTPPGTGDEPPAEPPPAEECSLLVSLIQADADYTSDVYLDSEPPELLIPDTRESVGEVVERYWDGSAPPEFFITVFSPEGTYPVYSDSPWSETIELGDGKWLVRFEDVSDDDSSDLDYNDVVLTAEALNCEGISPPPREEGVKVIVPGGGATRLHVNFLQASFGAGDLYLAGDPPELLIDKSSSSKGAGARNIFYEGEELVFVLADGEGRLSSSSDAGTWVEYVTDYNYRVHFYIGDSGDEEVIVHVVLTP